MRLAILTSHPIQYHAPLFRQLARQVDLRVFFAHRATPNQQAAAGFGKPFDWDTDILSDYSHEFLSNISSNPGVHRFEGCDTPAFDERLAEERADVLLVTGWHLKSYWQGIWAAKKRRIPIVVRGDSHLRSPRSLAKRIGKSVVYPPLLRVFDAGLFVGQLNRSYWLHYRYPENRLFFSPHCVDNKFFAARADPTSRIAVRTRFKVPAGAPVALFAGKLTPIKRPMDLVRAAAGVRARGIDLHVLVAGSGDLEVLMAKEAISLKVPVHFLGFQNQSEMPAAYAASDFLVLPSMETWGLVANEAIASGRPIIVSDAVGCAPDLAADPEVGLKFPYSDIRELTEAIMCMVQTRRVPEALERQSRLHSPDAACKGIVDALSYVTKRMSISVS